jgi:mRNA-degrading endonuclease RelE of RelBE toxin-antitoxin system
VIARLTQWPNVSGAKPLRHDLKGAYRIRTGDFRVVFIVKGNIVVITRIDNRRDVYRKK